MARSNHPATSMTRPGPARWTSYAAGAWSLLYAALALSWTLDNGGFPFGEGDPRAATMGSLLVGARAADTAPVIAGLCLTGATVALAMTRPWGSLLARRALAGFAWGAGVTLTVLLPDGRLLIHLAYALMLNVNGLDWTVLNQALCVTGGLLWGAAALHHQRQAHPPHRSHHTRTTIHRRAAATPGPAWGRPVTYIAAALPLVYAATRWTWALGGSLGFADSSYINNPQRQTTELVLGGLAVGGAVLTLGLIQRWGTIWPRWTLLLAGKPVPRALVVGLAGVVAVLLTGGGLLFWRALAMWVLGTAPDSTVFDPANWAAWLGNLTLLPWGLTLGAATLAYARRRQAGHRPHLRPRHPTRPTTAGRLER